MNTYTKTVIDWLLARLSENSTWRGIILLLTAAGTVIDPDMASTIIGTGLAIVGLINILINQSASKADVVKAIEQSENEPCISDTKTDTPPI